MTRPIIVRDAQEDDLPATASIIAAEAGGTTDEWLSRFAEVLRDPDRRFLVAEVDGQVVGFGQARLVRRQVSQDEMPPSGWYLSGVTVAAAHRRAGVGLALTEARLKQLGRVPVYYAAEPDNAATIRLHERLGFVPAGTVTLPGSDQRLSLFRREPESE